MRPPTNHGRLLLDGVSIYGIMYFLSSEVFTAQAQIRCNSYTILAFLALRHRCRRSAAWNGPMWPYGNPTPAGRGADSFRGSVNSFH